MVEISNNHLQEKQWKQPDVKLLHGSREDRLVS